MRCDGFWRRYEVEVLTRAQQDALNWRPRREWLGGGPLTKAARQAIRMRFNDREHYEQWLRETLRAAEED